MKFTDFFLIDPVMSLGVALFILTEAIKNLKECTEVFLMKAPDSLCYSATKNSILEIDGVLKVNRFYLWSIDGENHSASIHIVCNKNTEDIKKQVREMLYNKGVSHVTIETENAENLGTMQNDIFVIK